MRKLIEALMLTISDLWITHATEEGWWHHDLKRIAKNTGTRSTVSRRDISDALDAAFASPHDSILIDTLVGYCFSADKSDLQHVVDDMVPNDLDSLPDFYLKLLLFFKIIRIRNELRPSQTIDMEELLEQYTLTDLIPGPMIFHERVYIADKTMTESAKIFRQSCHYGRRSVQHGRGATVPLRIAYFCAQHAPTLERETFQLEKIKSILSKFQNSGHMTMDADIGLVMELLGNETSAISLDYIWSLDSNFQYGLTGLFHPQQIKKNGFFGKLWSSMTRKEPSLEDVEIGSVFHDLVHQKVIVGVKYSTYQSWIRALTVASSEMYTPKVMHDICRLVYLANKHRPDDLLNMSEILDTVDMHYPDLINEVGLHTWSLHTTWAKEPMPWWVYILAAMHVCALNGFEVILTFDHMTHDIERWMNLYPVEQGTNLCLNKNQELDTFLDQPLSTELVN